MTKNDFKERVKARHTGKLKEWQPKEQTTEMPKVFVEWVNDNKSRWQANGKAAPFFIRDNYQQGDVDKGLDTRITAAIEEAKLAAAKAKAKAKPTTPEPITEWDSEVMELRKIESVYSLDLDKMEHLRAEGTDRAALRKEINKQQRSYQQKKGKWEQAYQEAENQLQELRMLLVTYQSQENTKEFWELRDTIIPNYEPTIIQHNPASVGNAKEETKSLKSITSELIRIKTQYSDIFKTNAQIKLVETGDLRPETQTAADIRNLKDYKALEDYMKRNDICQDLKLEKLTFEDAREICAIWAQYKAEWNVSPIEKIGTNSRIKETTLAHASGKIMEINSKLFDKENAEKNKTEIYERNVKSYADNLKAKIEYNKKQIESYLSILHNREIAISAETEKEVRKEIAKMQRENKEHETTLNQGHTRHNVFISKEKVIENIVQHEFGHTIQDMLIGRNNDAHSMVLTRKQQSAMRSELIGLFNKYKNNCAWLSVYGTDTKEEFFAEGMVLYMAAGGAGMPEDVKNFYDKLKEIANM